MFSLVKYSDNKSVVQDSLKMVLLPPLPFFSRLAFLVLPGRGIIK